MVRESQPLGPRHLHLEDLGICLGRQAVPYARSIQQKIDRDDLAENTRGNNATGRTSSSGGPRDTRMQPGGDRCPLMDHLLAGYSPQESLGQTPQSLAIKEYMKRESAVEV